MRLLGPIVGRIARSGLKKDLQKLKTLLDEERCGLENGENGSGVRLLGVPACDYDPSVPTRGAPPCGRVN